MPMPEVLTKFPQIALQVLIMKSCKSCKNRSWMMALCFAPVILFIFLLTFFPNFVYLSFLGLLLCPISMGLVMYNMNKGACDHNEKKGFKKK